jgi:hypothetical protein
MVTRKVVLPQSHCGTLPVVGEVGDFQMSQDTARKPTIPLVVSFGIFQLAFESTDGVLT